MNVPRLHLVTDDGVLRDPGFAARAAAVLQTCGADVALHLRGHATPAGVLYRTAEAVRDLVRSGARVLANDRVDVARAAGLDGVQLGRRSIPIRSAREILGTGRMIGYSAHGVAEAARATAADFVVLGAVYPTASHPGRAAVGLDALRAAVAAGVGRVVAIGGVTPGRVAPVMEAGAHGVAVLSGVWSAGDPLAAALEFCEAIRAYAPEARQGRGG